MFRKLWRMDVIDHYRVVPCLVRKLFDNGLTRSARNLKSTLNTVPVANVCWQILSYVHWLHTVIVYLIYSVTIDTFGSLSGCTDDDALRTMCWQIIATMVNKLSFAVLSSYYRFHAENGWTNRYLVAMIICSQCRPPTAARKKLPIFVCVLLMHLRWPHSTHSLWKISSHSGGMIVSRIYSLHSTELYGKNGKWQQ